MRQNKWGVLMIGIALMVVGRPSPSFGATKNLKDLCSRDSIWNKAQARERNLWAAKCGYFGSNPNKTLEALDREGMYIVFSNVDPSSIPKDRNAPCDEKDRWYKGGYCLPGCYTPDTKLSFGGQELAIHEAFLESRQPHMKTLRTLAPNAVLERLTFKETPIKYFVIGHLKNPEPGELVAIWTQRNRLLKVTLEHPLVKSDGEMILAREVRPGISLLDELGQADLVVESSPLHYQGLVMNIAPESTKKNENILVAEGLLTGSHRFQLEWANQTYRLHLRETLDVTGL